MPSNHLIFCRPLLLLPSIFPSIRVFSNELVLRIRWPKYWSFSFNISPSDEHPGLMHFLYFSYLVAFVTCSSFVTFQIDTCARITNMSVKLFKDSFIVWDFLGAAVPTQKTYLSAFCLGETHAPFIHQLKLLLQKISLISLRSGGESGNCLSSEVIKNNPRT